MARFTFAAARIIAPVVTLAFGTSHCNPAKALEATLAGLPDLMRLSIEELSTMEISSVSRRPEPLSTAPSAIYVITADDIRLSGARSIPETLRLAPNLLVGRVDSMSYAISARGFNTVEASNKLLALMDGRSLYSPLHSGVYWDNHDTVLDDIERIEVISGPGGTLWGANAVNGVINITTKSSADTQGTQVRLGGGNFDQIAAARYGGRVNERLTFRGSVKAYRSGNAMTPVQNSAGDSFTRLQGGFRADWASDLDTVRVQGDIYNGLSDHASTKLRGGNAIISWTRTFEDSQFTAKAYYDNAIRIIPDVYDRVDSYDAEFQHNFKLGAANEIVWGGGYRNNTENFVNTLNIFQFLVPKRTLEHANVYVQDTYAITGSLHLIGGVKFEHNEHTGWEVMPSARVAWKVSESTLLWTAISRAVRTPNRIDRELQAQGLVVAAENFQSEELLAYEVGYRGILGADMSLSVSAYYNVYNDLRTTGASASGGIPYSLQNGRSGHTYGVESWATYRVSPRWRLDAGLNAMGKKTRVAIGQIDLIPDQHIGNDPDFQASVRSVFSLSAELDATLAVRTVGDLKSPPVPAYTEMDARLAWRALPNLELALSGENLLHRSHPEIGAAATRREVPRAVFASLRWAY